MIVEDKHIYSNKPDFDIPTGKLLQWIEKSFVETIPVFLHTLLPNLNEIQYAQEFVAELERTLRTMEIPLCVGREYSDIYTEGADKQRTVDFYFYPVEQGTSRKSLFSVEVVVTWKSFSRAKPQTMSSRGSKIRMGYFNCAFMGKVLGYWYHAGVVRVWVPMVLLFYIFSFGNRMRSAHACGSGIW